MTERGQRVRSRRRWLLAAGAFLLLTVAVLVAAFVPRTVAEGGDGADAWTLRLTPGLVAASARLEGPDGSPVAEVTDLDGLEGSVVWQYPVGDPDVTIVLGPTPRAATSLRVTSPERGVGEAAVERIGWRRVHVAVLPGDVWVTELVAIGPSGQVIEVVRDLPPPPVP